MELQAGLCIDSFRKLPPFLVLRQAALVSSLSSVATGTEIACFSSPLQRFGGHPKIFINDSKIRCMSILKVRSN
jgi:hypothetical protein